MLNRKKECLMTQKTTLVRSFFVVPPRIELGMDGRWKHGRQERSSFLILNKLHFQCSRTLTAFMCRARANFSIPP